jgi:ubiquinone/menaquinone biosynthesis C-methylase UbiE
MPFITNEKLIDHIKNIDKIGNEKWLSGLNKRKMEEMEFHNRDRDPEFKKTVADSEDSFEKFYGNKKYYNTTYRSREYTMGWIKKNAPGKVFLDYACGNGENALHAAEAGAALALGFDISNVSVANCRGFAESRGLTSTMFFQADAENTMLPDNCVDFIVCSGMLHHLNLSYAFPELRRILKPGGKILAIEALEYNPAIRAYRMMTPDMRTEYEKHHILGLKDITFAKRFFAIGEMRYWHIVGYAGGKFPFFAKLFDAVDRVLEKVPVIRLMSWIFTFELIKKSED